ncbi:hypothetical protein Tco_0667988 [Tanacetum coccineum]
MPHGGAWLQAGGTPIVVRWIQDRDLRDGVSAVGGSMMRRSIHPMRIHPGDSGKAVSEDGSPSQAEKNTARRREVSSEEDHRGAQKSSVSKRSGGKIGKRRNMAQLQRGNALLGFVSRMGVSEDRGASCGWLVMRRIEGDCGREEMAWINTISNKVRLQRLSQRREGAWLHKGKRSEAVCLSSGHDTYRQAVKCKINTALTESDKSVDRLGGGKEYASAKEGWWGSAVLGVSEERGEAMRSVKGRQATKGMACEHVENSSVEKCERGKSGRKNEAVHNKENRAQSSLHGMGQIAAVSGEKRIYAQHDLRGESISN